MTQPELDMTAPQAESGSTQLIVIEALKPKEVFGTTNGVTELLKELKEVAKPKLPADTAEGREERRTLAANIARAKTGVFNMGKDYVADLKKITKDVDAKKRIWFDEAEAYQHAVRKPLTDYEDAEKARIAGHKGKIQQMRDLMAFDYEPTSADVEERISKVTALAMAEFEEFKEEAQTVADNANGRLGEKLAAVIKAEEDAAELEAARIALAAQAEKDRVAQVQKEADEKAAKKAEADIEAANARAVAAEAKVHDASKANTPATEDYTPHPPGAGQPTTAPITEDYTPQPTAQPTTEDYKRTVNQSIVQALVDSCMLSENAAKAVVIEIARGKVPSTTITY